MIAVLFEALPAAGMKARYLHLAAALRSQLEHVDGFLSIERFESITEPGKLLSLSLWRDEAAIAAWRDTAAHRATQMEGRQSVFADYRLRVADVIRDYGMIDRAEAPLDSRRAHDHR